MAIVEITIIGNLENVESIEQWSGKSDIFDWEGEDGILDPVVHGKIGFLRGNQYFGV